MPAETKAATNCLVGQTAKWGGFALEAVATDNYDVVAIRVVGAEKTRPYLAVEITGFETNASLLKDGLVWATFRYLTNYEHASRHELRSLMSVLARSTYRVEPIFEGYSALAALLTLEWPPGTDTGMAETDHGG